MERLRKESSSVLTKDGAHVNDLLKQRETEKEKIRSFKLKLNWKKKGIYGNGP